MSVIDAGYSPANRMFTSKDEIEYVSELMCLSELDSFDLQNLRDMWVLYHNQVDIRDNEVNYKRFQSVIAIIDNEIYSK